MIKLGKYINIKNGNTYTVTGTVIDATNSCAGQIKVAYHDQHGKEYVREIEEFKVKFKEA